MEVVRLIIIAQGQGHPFGPGAEVSVVAAASLPTNQSAGTRCLRAPTIIVTAWKLCADVRAFLGLAGITLHI